MRTLQEVLSRYREAKTSTLVLVFVNHVEDDIIATVKRVCGAKHFCVCPTTMHDAEQALLDYFMVTSVPMCIFLRDNQWTYIMPHVTEHNLLDLVTYFMTQSPRAP